MESHGIENIIAAIDRINSACDVLLEAMSDDLDIWDTFSLFKGYNIIKSAINDFRLIWPELMDLESSEIEIVWNRLKTMFNNVMAVIQRYELVTGSNRPRKRTAAEDTVRTPEEIEQDEREE